jgi:hypothetical protein
MAKKPKPGIRQKTGFRGPSPDVGKATQFKPGVSGNPDGRPKKKPLTEALERLLSKYPAEADTVARAMVRRMKKGSVTHFREVADRVEGRVAEVHDVEIKIIDELAERVEKARRRAKK